MVKAALT